MSELSHGNIGKREQSFTSLLPLRENNYNPHHLAVLAAAMKGDVDTVKVRPDPEENILVPYFRRWTSLARLSSNVSSGSSLARYFSVLLFHFLIIVFVRHTERTTS